MKKIIFLLAMFFTISAISQEGTSELNLPTQKNNAGKYLKTDGKKMSWASVTAGVSASLTAGYIPYAVSSTSLANSGIYQSSGNIGINTTSPNSKFDIKATAYDTDIFSLSNTSGSVSRFRMQLNSNEDVLFKTINSDLIFNTFYTGGVPVETIRFTNTGKIKTATNSEFIIGSYNSSSNNFGYVSSSSNGTNGAGLKFSVTASSGSQSGIDAMTILTGGNVGIGTTSPSYPLHVIGDVGIGNAGYLRFKDVTDVQKSYMYFHNASNQFYHYSEGGYKNYTGYGGGVYFETSYAPFDIFVNRSDFSIRTQNSGSEDFIFKIKASSKTINTSSLPTYSGTLSSGDFFKYEDTGSPSGWSTGIMP